MRQPAIALPAPFPWMRRTFVQRFTFLELINQQEFHDGKSNPCAGIGKEVITTEIGGSYGIGVNLSGRTDMRFARRDIAKCTMPGHPVSVHRAFPSRSIRDLSSNFTLRVMTRANFAHTCAAEHTWEHIVFAMRDHSRASGRLIVVFRKSDELASRTFPKRDSRTSSRETIPKVFESAASRTMPNWLRPSWSSRRMSS
ncbi:MAG: hypothetical protein JWM11_4224 [Planctomycetaceae bacterium]|nr:hypothetical protein [Planctomycetaceae bacterium]